MERNKQLYDENALLKDKDQQRWMEYRFMEDELNE